MTVPPFSNSRAAFRSAHCHRISADTKSVTHLDEEIAFELVSQPLKIIVPWSRTLCMVPDEGFCTMPNSKAGFAQLVSPKIPHPTKTVGLIIIEAPFKDLDR